MSSVLKWMQINLEVKQVPELNLNLNLSSLFLFGTGGLVVDFFLVFQSVHPSVIQERVETRGVLWKNSSVSALTVGTQTGADKGQSSCQLRVEAGCVCGVCVWGGGAVTCSQISSCSDFGGWGGRRGVEGDE